MPSPEVALGLASVHIDWGAAAVFIVLLGTASAVAARAYSAPDTVFRTYQANLDLAKANIDGERVIPKLVELIEAVIRRASGGAVAMPASEVEGALRWAGYLAALGTLSTFYADLGRLEELPGVITRWARVRAAGAAGGLVALVPVGIHFVLQNAPVPAWLWVSAAAVALITFAVAGMAWFLDASARNELTSLFTKYRQ